MFADQTRYLILQMLVHRFDQRLLSLVLLLFEGKGVTPVAQEEKGSWKKRQKKKKEKKETPQQNREAVLWQVGNQPQCLERKKKTQ